MKFLGKKMGEDHVALCPSGRAIEQAIMALKKGAHLLKCGSNGKTKFCSFRLSMDEKFLVWCSGQKEKQLKLSSVIDINRGQCTKQMQAEKEGQSFSLVYADGERYLHVICKDKKQADCWCLGLKVVLSRSQQHHMVSSVLKVPRVAQSCVSSPASFMRRKQIFGLSTAKSSKVQSINGSPAQSFPETRFSDDFSCSSESFYSESSRSSKHNEVDILSSGSPAVGPHWLNSTSEMQCLRQPPKINRLSAVVLRDVLIWGEGAERGFTSRHEPQPCDALLPKLLDSAVMLDIASISLGAKHAAIATKQGEIFCWGDGKNGRLGHKHGFDAASPKIVDSLSGVYVRSVTCGEYQTCALTDSGELYVWGDTTKSHWLPHKVSGFLSGVSVVSVACGEWHTAIVSVTGQLYTFGDGTFGVLGHGDLQSTCHPKEIESLRGFYVKSVACGPWHTAAVVDISKQNPKTSANMSGKLFTWGDGDEGKLGHSDRERKLVPTRVSQLLDHDFVQVGCGRTITVGLTNTGNVYTMGSMVHGQLGDPHARDKSLTLVQGKLRDESVTEISVGSYHIAALTSKGYAFTWGKGKNGQLGLGDTNDRNSPTLVEALGDRKVERITCGSSTTAVICLHKSTLTADQSACTGCATAFGFTKKKQNCYNCGLLFCRACCGNKATNASMAPNKVGPFRVCDACFRKLQRGFVADCSSTPRPLSTSQQILFGERDDKGERSTAWSRMKLTRRFSDDGGTKGRYQQSSDSVTSSYDGLQRWGQVSCPEFFKRNGGEQQTPLPFQTSLRTPSPCHPEFSCALDSNFTAINEGKKLSLSRKDITEEVQKLQSQVENLKKICKTRKEKIEEYQQKIEEAWSLAKDEAAKSKAAKEVIRALATKLHTMSDKLSDGRDQVCANSGHVASTRVDDSPYISNFFPVVADSEFLPDRKTESLSSSMYLGEQSYNVETTLLQKTDQLKADSSGQQQPDRVKPLKQEWTEQFQPGVYITLAMHSNAQKSLRRVRFSRKKFSESEAKLWWDENQQLVYQKYEIADIQVHGLPRCDDIY